MVPRSFWKGYLKLSLVTCPVAMIPATTDNDKVRFHVLNAKTGNRVVTRYVDEISGKPVDADDEVKGYPRGEDDFVMLEDEDLDAVALDSTRTIAIDSFVPADSIDWIWFDTPHYLVPNDSVGEEAFAVIRAAMAATRTVGISRVVLYRRERAVLLQPRGSGIVLWTLRYGDEVRGEAEYFDAAKGGKTDPKAMALMTKLIKDRSQTWTPAMISDPVQANVLEIIAAKKKSGKRGAKPKAEVDKPSGNVINIMDALKKSIASEGKSRKS
ncbi:MAG: Ku protein [bacterium]